MNSKKNSGSARSDADALELDHIGYAVESIERYIEEFVTPMLRPEAIGKIVEDPLQKVRIAFVTLKGGARIELIQPLDDTSPVSQRLKAKQGGLYHLCYAVDDIEKQIKRFRDCGCWLVSGPTPAVACGERRVAFLATRRNDIIELVERSAVKRGGCGR